MGHLIPWDTYFESPQSNSWENVLGLLPSPAAIHNSIDPGDSSDESSDLDGITNAQPLHTKSFEDRDDLARLATSKDNLVFNVSIANSGTRPGVLDKRELTPADKEQWRGPYWPVRTTLYISLFP